MMDSRWRVKPLMRSTDDMESLSFTECTSYMFGPKETESIPSILLLMIPHSRPAWIAVIPGFLPVYSSYAFAQNPVRAEWGFGFQDGYAPSKTHLGAAQLED